MWKQILEILDLLFIIPGDKNEKGINTLIEIHKQTWTRN